MQIKFMSFNIQSCRDYINRNFDPLLMANTIKKCEAEIIGLNEVRSVGPGENFINHVEIISQTLGYKYYYFGKAIDLPNGPYGNGLISKYEIKNAITIPIPDPIVKDEDAYYETRCIIKAEILNFTVLVVHVGLAKGEARNAINTLIAVIKTIKTPVILMGDFNMTPDNTILAPIKDLLQDTAVKFTSPLLSFPSINAIKKIDYIFISQDIEILDADIPKITASDHYPHTAILKIKES